MQRPFDWLSEQLAAIAEHLPTIPVAPGADSSAQIHSFLAEHFELSHQAPLDQACELTASLMRGWPTHAGHPQNFASMYGDVHPSGLIGDSLANAWDVHSSAHASSPLAQEIETFVVAFLCHHIGFKPQQSNGFCTADAAQANQLALVTALAQCFPGYAESGVRACEGRPLIYHSQANADGLAALLTATGLGRESLRLVPCTSDGQLDVKALRRMIIEDARNDHTPFMVIASAGTAAGAIDPIKGLAALARVQGMWLHVDASGGGMGLLCDALKTDFDGLRFADSVALDTRTVFAVPGPGGIFLCRHAEPMQYLPPATSAGMAIKAFLALAHLGADGYSDLLQHQLNMASELEALLSQKNWRVQRPSLLPVLLIQDPGLNLANEQSSRYLCWIDTLQAEHNTLLSVVQNGDGQDCIRVCISNFATSLASLQDLARNLERIRRMAK
jgi:glutamate/tyrosine decarboxylase-like PLP-dependent enzyme